MRPGTFVIQGLVAPHPEYSPGEHWNGGQPPCFKLEVSLWMVEDWKECERADEDAC
jgi:hypothetical protein